MKSHDPLAVIEACYMVERDRQSWLDDVHAALAPILDRGLGTCAYRYDLLSPQLEIHETAEQNAAIDVSAMKASLKTVTADYIANSYRSLTCAMASEVPGFEEQPSVKLFFRPAGVGDIFALNAFDACGVGIWVGAFHPKKAKLSAGARAVYDRLAAHVGAGFRLRDRLALETAPAEAIMTPNGRVVHAEGEAKLANPRRALRDAVDAMERARGRLRRRDPERALREWRALVSARWSLVDQFERDGKRYVVARENSPRQVGIRSLAPRELQVLSYAVLGHHNKLIAYELGLAPSTVRVLLMRAARKLRTRSRHATIAKFARLTSK